MDNKVLITGKNAFGIPDNGIMQMEDSQWIPVWNVHRKFKSHTRHYYATCPECGKKKKNIRLHYKKYHPRFWDKYFNKIHSGEIGELYGFRIVETSSLTIE